MRTAKPITLALLLALAATARAATPDQVEASLTRAKDYLYKQMEKDGTWEHGAEPTKAALAKDVVRESRWGGTTALSLYALLAAGERPNEPRLQPAIAFLKKAQLVGTYPIAVRILAMSYLPATPDVKALVKKDQAALLAMVQTEGNAKGMYDYVSRELRNASRERPSKKQPYSHSRAQYGLLGMWVATEMGLDSPLAYWKTAEEGWMRNQDPSGGWNYTHPADVWKDDKVTVGRTAAGVASLYLVQDFTHPTAELKGNVTNPAVDKGLAWLGANFANLLASHTKDDYLCSTLYVVERVGVASGIKYLGKLDWFEEGANLLLKEQNANGGFSGQGSAAGVDTAFAILFLARGRAPIMVEKLMYDTGPANNRKPGLWNQRPRDIANIVRFHSKQIEREVNWQIADLNMPAKELLDAPILYIAGMGPVAFSEDDESKLRDYVHAGGLILCHADGSDPAFTNSMQKLGQKLFGGYEFRPLPEKHPAFKLLDRSSGGPVPTVIGLSNGIRELMLILTTGDPARRWQMQNLKADGKNAAELMEGIMQYVSETKLLRYRGDDVLLAENPNATEQSTIRVGRIEYAGNWNPEPGSWPRLGRYVKNTFNRKVVTEPVKLATANLADYSLLHLTGTAKFRLDPNEESALKQFVQQGGTLLVENAGGSATGFNETAADLLKKLFNDSPTTLPPTHPLFSAGNTKPMEPQYRTFTLKTTPTQTAPRLKAIELANRPAILFSEEDLTGAWVGYNFDAINGYTPDYALNLGARILLSSQKKEPPPPHPPRPTPQSSCLHNHRIFVFKQAQGHRSSTANKPKKASDNATLSPHSSSVTGSSDKLQIRLSLWSTLPLSDQASV